MAKKQSSPISRRVTNVTIPRVGAAKQGARKPTYVFEDGFDVPALYATLYVTCTILCKLHYACIRYNDICN